MIRPQPFVVCLALVLSWRVALARPKVALTPIEGDASGEIREAVAEALEGKELSLIDSKEVKSAVDKLGSRKALTEQDLKKLAGELDADAVIAGKLDRAGETRTLKFRLYVNKQLAKGFTVSFKDARSEKFRTLLHDKMVDKLGAVASDDRKPSAPAADDAARPAPDAGSRPVKPAVPADPAAPAMPPAIAPAAATPAPADASAQPGTATPAVAAAGSAGAADTGVATTAAPVRPANLAAARLDAGISFAQRSFAFTSNLATGKPVDNTLGAAPGIRVEGEVYPLAILKPASPFAKLGLAIDYDKTLGLNVTTGQMPGVNASVNQTAYSVGVRYRYAFGNTPRSATLTAGVGYGKRVFSPDRAGFTNPQAASDSARDNPETSYSIIDPGAAFRMPVTRMVAVSLAARGLVITDTGAISDGATSYGAASVFGVEVVAGVDVLLGKRFVVRLAGEFVQIGFSFNGGGKLSNGIDGDLTSKDVSGLTDRSLGGTATFGVVY